MSRGVNKINAVNNSPTSSSTNSSDSASAVLSGDSSILEDAPQAVKHWESNFNKKLSPKK